MASAWGAAWGLAWGNSWSRSTTTTPQQSPYYGGGEHVDTSWWDDLLEDLAAVKKAVRKKKPTLAQSAQALAAAIDAQQLALNVDLEDLRRATERLRQLIAEVDGAIQIEKARQAVLAEAQRSIAYARAMKRQQEDDEFVEILLLSAI